MRVYFKYSLDSSRSPTVVSLQRPSVVVVVAAAAAIAAGVLPQPGEQSLLHSRWPWPSQCSA